MSTQTEINEALVQYLQSVGYREDKIITELENETLKLGSVSQMQIAKEQGQFLEMITKISNAKNCLEIGRFTGMSTLFLARGIPESGKIVTVDNSDEFLSLAKKYWELDNMSSKIESIIGDGVEVMQSMIDRQQSYDLIFIDADKNNYPHYYELSLKLLPTNGIIIIDNMLWGGSVADSSSIDSQTKTIRLLNEKIQNELNSLKQLQSAVENTSLSNASAMKQTLTNAKASLEKMKASGNNQGNQLVGREVISERIDANLLNIGVQQLTDIPRQMFENKVTKLSEKTQGALIIKEAAPECREHSTLFSLM